MITEIDGDITESDAQYIAHQCNCKSNGQAAGLAFTMFEKFPWSECYKSKKPNITPGTIDIRGNGKDQRFVINMYGQFYPGGMTISPNNVLDGQVVRQLYFEHCLGQIYNHKENIQSIAFPAQIGCGLAGGNWMNYKNMIKRFDEQMNEDDNECQVIIVDFNK